MKLMRSGEMTDLARKLKETLSFQRHWTLLQKAVHYKGKDYMASIHIHSQWLWEGFGSIRHAPERAPGGEGRGGGSKSKHTPAHFNVTK